MAIAVQMDYTVDLCKPAHLIQMDVPFFTGDKNAHRFHVKLIRNGCDVDASGLSAMGYMVRADKQTVVWDGEVDGCDIYLTMPAACYAVPGRFRLLLRVALGDTVETALWVEGSMREGATDTVVDPGDTLPNLEELLAQIAAMEAATKEAKQVVSGAIVNRDGLPDGTDFDTIRENGMYYAYSSRTYPNSPGKYMGVLTVFKRSDGAIVQDFVNASSGNRYVRYYISSWTAWQQGTAMHNCGALATDADFNSVTTNGIYYAQTPNTQTNRPESGAGLLTVTTQKSVTTQDWVNIQTGARWVRWGMNGTWRDWMSCIPDTVMLNRGALADGTDFDTIKANGVFYAYGSRTYPNSPDNSTGLMHVFVRTDGFVVQDYTNPDNGKRFARYCYTDGTWTAWKQSDLAKDRKAVYYAFGDSTTYGQIAVTGGQSKYNYPACVGRALDMVVKNKGVPGQSLIVDWDTIHTDFIDGLDMSDASLISVGWAYNTPETLTKTMNFGSALDTTPDTFIGYYYTIMKEFQEKCPNAQVILITGYGLAGTKYSQFKAGYTFLEGVKSMQTIYNTLEEMCHINGWCCINQAKGTWINRLNWNTYIGDSIHPTNEGYIRYGNFMAAKISSIYTNIAAW